MHLEQSAEAHGARPPHQRSEHGTRRRRRRHRLLVQKSCEDPQLRFPTWLSALLLSRGLLRQTEQGRRRRRRLDGAVDGAAQGAALSPPRNRRRRHRRRRRCPFGAA
jgi:hypothetical protein